MKRIWRLDIAVLVRHDVCMDRRDLARLGHHVVSRRVALGFRNRTDLAKSLAKTLQDRRTAYGAEAKTLDTVLKEVAKDLDSLN